MANAKEIIALRDRELSRQSNFRNLWQDTADLMYTLENKIVNTRTPGEPLTTHLHDITAKTEKDNMTSGLISQLIPAGQEFFGLRASDRKLNALQNIERYFSQITEGAHEEMFNSNFMLQLDNTIKSEIVFGTGNIFSDWRFGKGLFYRDYPIGSYQVLENDMGIIDTMIMTIPKTASQAEEKFGDKLGPLVKAALAKEADVNEMFNFIHLVRPRKQRQRGRIDVLGMPFESFYVGEMDMDIIEESGFPEFPFHTPRWTKGSSEVYGRGVGTEILPQVRVIQRMMRDLIECGNKWNGPPLEILESGFDGNVDVTPNAQNFVTQMKSIAAIDQGVRGSFPITKEMLEDQRTIIRDAFFKNVFEQLATLTGDRRTTLEIVERLKEGLKKLSNPIGRLFSELFNTLIPRTVLLLIRNGVLPQPPAELRGKSFKVEYTGPLALALKDQHVRAFEFWVGLIGTMNEVFPGVADNVDSDEAIRDIGQFLGVKTNHIRSERDRDAKRAEDAKAAQADRQLEIAAMAAQGYGQTTKAPEPGSGAEQIQAAIAG